MLLPTFFVSLLSLITLASAQATNGTTSQNSTSALYEPPDGSLYFGVWLDTSVTSGDSPLALNQRLGRNVSWFQFSQNIPVDPYDDITGTGGIINASMVFETETDAGIYVTVYPLQGLGYVTAQDLASLGIQLQSYITAGHAVFLRFAPEMNGNWFPYAMQPTMFKSVWKTMYNSIKTSCPTCGIVWSPNSAIGYPFGITLDQVNATDATALDTNGDGNLDYTDDAYLPYYPGDEYVDWTGLSYYYKGNFPNSYNVINPPGYFEGGLTGVLEAVADINQGETQYTPFYDTYCVRMPCMFSESGSAWKVNQTGLPEGFTSPTHQAVEAGWWEDGITNLTFLTTYPRVKMIMNFEWEKVETDGNIPTLRDFRLTNNTLVLEGFSSDLDNVADRYIWASYKPQPVTGGGSGAGPQVPLPQATVQRATPYRAATPSVLSLFSSGAVSSALRGWATLATLLVGGAAIGVSLVVT